MDDSNSDVSLPEPAGLRRLRIMVMILTGTLTLGFLVIVGLMVAAFTREPAQVSDALPDNVALPDGETAQAFTRSERWFAVVTADAEGVERIRIFATDGSALQTVEIAR